MVHEKKNRNLETINKTQKQITIKEAPVRGKEAGFHKYNVKYKSKYQESRCKKQDTKAECKLMILEERNKYPYDRIEIKWNKIEYICKISQGK